MRISPQKFDLPDVMTSPERARSILGDWIGGRRAASDIPSSRLVVFPGTAAASGGWFPRSLRPAASSAT